MDLQIVASRHKRENTSSNRNLFRIAGILFLVLGTTIALFALQYKAMDFVSSHPKPAPAQPLSTQPASEKH